MAHMTREQHTRMLCTAGLMAALACVSNFISIATPASRIHIGNAVCVLCGLILGPAVRLLRRRRWATAIFDIIGGYGMEFIITFINKGAIALVTGLIAYKAASKETLERQGSRPHHRRQRPRRADLYRALPAQILSSSCASPPANVDPAAIQATMLSKASEQPVQRRVCLHRRADLLQRSAQAAAPSRPVRQGLQPVRPIGFSWPASKAGLFW